MADTTDVVGLLARWFERGDELAHRRAYALLSRGFYATSEAVAVLGSGAVEEIRVDVLVRLLDRTEGKLRDVAAPEAYTKAAWRNALFSELRKWGPRQSRKDEVEDYLLQIAPQSEVETVETAIDAERAIRIAEALDGRGRLAVLLTTRPDRISTKDWDDLVAALPPPPPERPNEPLEREAASMLLYPPREGSETAAQRYQRLNSFDKAYTRAVARIREALEVDE